MNYTLDEVKAIQASIRAVFATQAGQDMMTFLENAVGYDSTIFDATHRDMCLINDGKRQVVATLKAFLKLNPESIVALAQSKE